GSLGGSGSLLVGGGGAPESGPLLLPLVQADSMRIVMTNTDAPARSAKARGTLEGSLPNGEPTRICDCVPRSESRPGSRLSPARPGTEHPIWIPSFHCARVTRSRRLCIVMREWPERQGFLGISGWKNECRRSTHPAQASHHREHHRHDDRVVRLLSLLHRHRA